MWRKNSSSTDRGSSKDGPLKEAGLPPGRLTSRGERRSGTRLGWYGASAVGALLVVGVVLGSSATMGWARVLFGVYALAATQFSGIVSSKPVQTFVGNATACAKIASFKQTNVGILYTKYYATPQSFALPGADPSCSTSASSTVPLCRVVANITTSSTSSVQMEVWLPDEWYGRSAAVGNGGLNGCIDYANLQYLSDFHFAVVGGNNGHNGSTGAPFYRKPEVVTDFSHRAMHTQTDVSKQIINAYYGRSPSKSYYVGCSTGGRQGFQSILKYPEDFDGVLAGAPATDFNHLLAWSAYMSKLTGAPNPSQSDSDIPAAMLEVIRADTVKACDALDGVTDGIIDDPDNCQYDPARLQCGSGNCLTQPQVNALRGVYSPLKNSSGAVIYPRLDPGSALNFLMFGGIFFPFSLDWYRYVLYSDTTWTGSTFGNKTIEDNDKLNAGDIATWSGDMSAFADRGGKVITYHGRQDQLIPSGNSVRLFKLITDTMGASSRDEFYRFFPIPGMDHCSGGTGASRFGQAVGQSAGAPNDTDHNVLLALVDWVEGGTAPNDIVGTKFRGNNPAQGIVLQRVFCALPKVSKSSDGGKTWACA